MNHMFCANQYLRVSQQQTRVLIPDYVTDESSGTVRTTEEHPNLNLTVTMNTGDVLWTVYDGFGYPVPEALQNGWSSPANPINIVIPAKPFRRYFVLLHCQNPGGVGCQGHATLTTV